MGEATAEAMNTQQQYSDGDYLRYVFIPRPRCPACESMDLKTLRSVDQGDGTRRKRTKCNECNHTFDVILD